MLPVLLDILTVAVFLIVIGSGWRKGLIRSLISLIGTLLSYVVAFVLSEPVGKWLNGTFVGKYVDTQITHLLTDAKPTGGTGDLLGGIFSALPAKIVEAASALNKGLGTLGAKALDAVVDALSAPIATVISRGIAFFVIFLLCMAVLGVVAHLSDLLSRLPGVGSLNRLGGALVGAVEAVLLLFFLSTLLAYLIPLLVLGGNPVLNYDTVDATLFYKYIDAANPLSGMLLKV